MFRGLVEGHAWPLQRDEEVTELLASARSLRDRDARIRAYHEADRLWVAERAALVPLGYGRLALARRPWIAGVWGNSFVAGHLGEAVVQRQRETAAASG